MTKAELIEKAAKTTGLSKKDTDAALSAFTDAIMGAVKKGQKVALIGFGTFSTSKRKARKGRNPRTGTEIKIPACKAVRFTVGKKFKDMVNGK